MIKTLDKIKGWDDERQLMDYICYIVIALGRFCRRLYNFSWHKNS